MERALAIYEKDGNRRQAAAARYQLALFYARTWTCQRDEARTREKLSAAFENYGHAYRYFLGAVRGNEPTTAILSLDLASLYASVMSGEECLTKALACCLDARDAFAPEGCATRDRNRDKDWYEKMTTLSDSVEDRVFKLLLNLVKIEKDKTNSNVDAGKKEGKFK